MASIINATTTAGVSVAGDNSGSLQLATNNGTTAVTIDTSQNVGIGTSSPARLLDLAAPNAGGGGGLRITSTTGTNGVMVNLKNTAGNFYYAIDTSAGGTFGKPDAAILWYDAAQPMVFATNNTERMRIDSSGNLLVGTTGISTGTFKGIQNAAGGAGANYLSRNSSGTAGRQWNFGMNNVDEYVVYGHNGTSFNSGAYIAWGGTSWTAQSDERSKDIIEPITDAVNKVFTLRAVIGKYKTDEEGKRRSFLIAQDVQAVLPEAVDASKPDNLGVQYTEVIPLLVAAIKELKAELDATKAEVQALKGTL